MTMSAAAIAITSCGGPGDRGDAEGEGLDRGAGAEAVVGIVASGCSLVDDFGTGIAVSPDLIVTSAHTIAGASDTTVVTKDGDHLRSTVVGFDPAKDVAVLRVDGSLPYALLGQAEPSTNGVLATWHPSHGFDEATVEVLRLLRVTIEDIYIDKIGERLALEIAGEVVHGDSGGPIILEDGSVAGIIYAASRDRELTGFALRSVEVEALLANVTGSAVDGGHCF